jgi:tRNA(Ile)-lysidine synthase
MRSAGFVREHSSRYDNLVSSANGPSDVGSVLTRRLLAAIQAQRMLCAGDRIGVGVSGGADSVALLRLLQGASAELGIRLTVLHFNHQLRGAESDADEAFVARLAAERAMEFIAGREDVARAARTHGWNLEDAARRLRYAFFAAMVAAGRVARVAVAHTADDQAETVLARLLRGTGPAGLAAIYPVKGHVIRPLLDVRRADLRDYLTAMGQPWREDPSNLDITRLRARLRQQILPALERELQPAIVEHLSRLARMAREDELFWVALVDERIARLARREGQRLGIRCGDLLAPLADAIAGMSGEAQRALTGRLVRGLVAALRGDGRQLTAKHVEQVLHLAEKGPSGRRAELPGAIVERSFDTLWFEIAAPPPVEETKLGAAESKRVGAAGKEFARAISLVRPGEAVTIAVPEIGRRFRLKVIDLSGPARGTKLTGEAIDRELLRPPLVLRNWRPGDSFRPQGRRRRRKLKELLRESRIPVRDRLGWPVLTSEGSLVWARGLPVAVEFAPGETTRTGVVITEEVL